MGTIRKKKKKKSFLKRFITAKYRFVRYEYYSSFNVISHYLDLQKILEPEDVEIIRTETPINFRGIPFASLTAGVIDKLGEPRFKIDNSSAIKGHRILFYKERVGSVSVKIQLHFIREKLFYANYAFDPQKMGTRLIEEITNILTDKYLDREKEDLGGKMLVDEQNNKLMIRNMGLFEIGYISGSEYFKGYLREKVQGLKKDRAETERISLKNLFQDI